MNLKAFVDSRVEKLKSFTGNSYAKSPKAKLWIIRATTAALLWTCVVQFTALRDTWGPMVLKSWLSHDSLYATALDDEVLPIVPARVLPPKRVYKNNESPFFLISIRLGKGVGLIFQARYSKGLWWGYRDCKRIQNSVIGEFQHWNEKC